MNINKTSGSWPDSNSSLYQGFDVTFIQNEKISPIEVHHHRLNKVNPINSGYKSVSQNQLR